MLHITCKKDESVQLKTPQGEVVEIKISKIYGNQTRLSIDASKTIVIKRSERLKKAL